jgi:predicted metal-dependent HD superfamily phosphohydrolase
MVALGLPEELETFRALTAAYAEKHRHYHSAKHIDHCLQELDAASNIAHDAAEVELALWYHDAIYDPYSSNNEERSADRACALLNRHNVSAARVERVRELILATRHAAPATSPDAQLVVDVDLSILGADEAAYGVFEADVRKEYRWVPALVFRRKRAEILQSFLERPQIYATEPFHARYELRARHNLTAALESLRA